MGETPNQSAITAKFEDCKTSILCELLLSGDVWVVAVSLLVLLKVNNDVNIHNVHYVYSNAVHSAESSK